MVAWYADGLLAGYSPSAKSMDYVFHFASSGTVDVNAETRIHYALNAAYGTAVANFSKRFNVSAAITFAQADITAMGVTTTNGRGISMGTFCVPATAFPAGKVPTPLEIYNKAKEAGSGGSVSFGDQYWSNIGATPIDHLYVNATNVSGSANSKWWIMQTPVRLNSISGGATFANVIPMGVVNAAYWTHARAISAWVNQSPTKPVITSPSQEAPPGTIVDIAYTPGDPDTSLPDDTAKLNRDLAAVEFQYAAMPTPENPTPVWQRLMFKVDEFSVEGDSTIWSELGQSTYCRVGSGQGLRQGIQSPHDDRKVSLIESLKMRLYCGYAPDNDSSLDYEAGTSSWPVGTAALPGGDWQIRVRTFDWGHPYAGEDFSGASGTVSPLGLSIPYNQWIELGSYPAVNTSEWSDPIQVSITSQVPPPVPLSPTQDIAIEAGNTVRLSWQYLNTHVPPFAQTFRTVQIRKVGDVEWSTIVDDMEPDTFFDLPPEFIHPPVDPIEYETDPSFEGGGLAGWEVYPNPNFDPPVLQGTLANDAVSGNAHTGTRYLHAGAYPNAVGTIGSYSIIRRLYDDLDSDHSLFTASGWVHADPAEGAGLVVQMSWLDVNGDQLLPDDLDPQDPDTYGPYVNYAVIGNPGSWTGNAPFPSTWVQYQTSVARHPAGDRLSVLLQMDGNDPALNAPTSGWDLDDTSMIGSAGGIDDFSLVAGTEYEWRVQVIDFDGVKSDWSNAARFWIVEPAGTGPVRPAPVSLIEGATLGCGTHRVFVYRRGGKVRVGELTQLSHVDWGRLRDDMSTAKVVVSGWTEDCGRLLAALQTWAYELVIFRNNGFSTERVWEGPITLLTYEVDKVTINAKDVVAYPYRRIIKQAMSDSQNGDTVVKRAVRVLQNTIAPDDPNVLAYLTPIHKDDDAREYRSTPAYSRTAFEEIDDMAANAGLDYTAVGRSIILWDTSHRIGTLPEFRDDDLGSPPIVSEYGMSMSNRYSVSDGNGVHGEAERGLDDSGNDPIYGLIEMLSSTWASDSEEDTGTYTQAGLETTRQSFVDFAERSIADRYPPPVVVRVPDNTTLNPSALVSIQQLVPGVAIPLRSTGTLRSVVATQKLDSIKVVEEGGKETITVTMSPFGSDDAAIGEGEGEA